MNGGLQALGSGGEPKVEKTGEQPYLAATDISIRLWTSSQLQLKSSEVSWKTGSNLVFMIADVVTAAQGIPADTLRSGMSAHFDNVPQALKAAKSIERSVTEFCKQHPDDCFGVAIAVHRPIELRPFLEGDPSPASPGAFLLRQARPGQILVSRETSEQLRTLSGLQLRPLDAEAAAGGDHELLWTSPENYEQLAARLQEAERRFPQRNDQDSLPVLEEPQSSFPLNTVEFRTGRLPASDALSQSSAIEDRGGWLSLHPIAVSLCAVAVLGLVVVFAIPTFHKNSPPVRPIESPQPAAQEPLPNNPAPLVMPPPEPEKVQVRNPGNTRKTEAIKAPPPPPKPQEVKPVAEYEGFTAKDIPLLLKKAQADAGAGDYEASRREYEIVLRLEPANQAARTGLSRVILSRDRK